METNYLILSFDEISPKRMDFKYNCYHKMNPDFFDMGTHVLGDCIELFNNPVRFVQDKEYKYYGSSTNAIDADGNFVEYEIISGSKPPSRAKQLLEKGTIVITNLEGNRSMPAIVTENVAGSVLSSAFYMLRPKNNIDLEYLKLILHSRYVQEYLRNYCSAGLNVAVATWGLDELFAIPINLPSLDEQKITLAIVKEKVYEINKMIRNLYELKAQNTLFSIVDRVMQEELMINQAEYVLDRYNQVNDGKSNIIVNSFDNMGSELDYVYNTPFSITNEIKSRFQWIFLQELLEVKISTGAYAKKIDTETGYCRIMVKNLSSEDENMKIDDVDNITESAFLSTTNVNHLKYGDILFSGSGAGGLGNMVINLTDLKGIIDSHVGIIRLKESVNQLFVYYYLTSYLGQQQILRCVTGTTGQISINLNKLKKIVIPLLTDEKMEEIIEKINREKEHGTIYDKKINAMQQALNSSIDEFILHGYNENLFSISEEVMA